MDNAVSLYDGTECKEEAQSLSQPVFPEEGENEARSGNSTKFLSVSELLVGKLAAWTLEKRCHYVVLTTGRFMPRAVSAYKRLGFAGHELPVDVLFAARSVDLVKKHGGAILQN